MADPHRFPSYVIAITGVSAAGKSTLIREVAARLGDATELPVDDYALAEGSVTPDAVEWLRAGADPDAWQRPLLAAHLRRLRQGEAVPNPRAGTVTAPARYVLTDEWFGRARAELHGLIDFVACIDVPLEIALARHVLRASGAFRDGEQFRARVERNMNLFLHGGIRDAMLRTNAIAMADCELVVDGAKSPGLLADEVVGAVRTHREGHTRSP